jgi:NADPH:quinone reductase
MRAYYLRAEDGKPVSELREVPRPEPAAGEILIRTRAAGLNRGEYVIGHGVALASSGAPPRPSGIEAAGEIVALGTYTTGLAIGQRVMGLGRGAFAEYAVLDAGLVLPVPEAMGWNEAAAIPVGFSTSYDMLVANGEVKPEEWVLVTGISSCVGVASLKIAKALGAKVIGSSGSAAKLEKLRAHGLDHGIVARGPLPLEEIRDVTAGHGADVAINNVGGTAFPSLISALAYRGRLAIVGYVDGVVSAVTDLDTVHANRLRIFGVSNKRRSLAERRASFAAFRRDLEPMIRGGTLRPLIDAAFPFERLPDAQARMLANEQVGKIVVTL